MNLDQIIRELHDERNRLDRIIRALEEQDLGAKPAKSRRGRKSMDGEARKQVSERMKRYWASRREQQANEGQERGAASGAVSKGEWRYQAASVSPCGPGCDGVVTHAGTGRIQ